MKSFLYGLLISLSTAGFGFPAATSMTSPKPAPTRAGTPDRQAAGRTVVRFLQWYSSHLDSAGRIILVDQPAGKNYSVNFRNGEKYLALLKNSGHLTDAYLNEWRTYFRDRQKGFELNPQKEGPPTGFEYDLVLLSQNADVQMKNLNRLRIDKVTVRADRATVQCTLLENYEFRLVRRNNRWLINEILNLSAE
ncbi:hypothetical protein [Larkinella soli]|uniref:hypothetical protein n=1 Tax=Larkinella soli TaxID=1770527 RepID=UPI001E36A776|nr:hypothetical protein [Larkinella soli]